MKKPRTKDYTLHLIIGIGLFAAIVNTPACYNMEDSALPYRYGKPIPPMPPAPHTIEIIEINTDPRGLISCTYTDGIDTAGLDYMTVKGFNHLLRGEVDSVYNDAPQPHNCIDPTHRDCDGYCECDGLECPPVK